MIQKTPAFMTTDGNTYSTLELAQRAELFKIFANSTLRNDEQTASLCSDVYDNRAAICEILRASGRKPRKANNGKTRKTRKASAQAAE